MAVRTALVTDSTCNLFPELVAEKRIHVVPLYVVWGDHSYKDGVDITEPELYRRLNESPEIPTTSQASPQDFVELFERARQAENADEVVCGVLSSALSGTYASAIQAKEMVDFPVHVVDTRLVSWSLGFSILNAAAMRDAGGSPADLVQLLKTSVERTSLLFTVESLEFLHRGGRIGNAARLLGTALSIKPLLELKSGMVEAVDKVRTRKRAINHMIKVTQERANGRPVRRLAVIHGDVEADARMLLDEAREALSPGEAYVSYVAAALAVHTGPGAVGIIVEWEA